MADAPAVEEFDEYDPDERCPRCGMPADYPDPSDDHEPELVPCRMCENGEWWTECCSGSGGCSCRGEPINMGRCNICGGSGYHPVEADQRANVRAIEGFGFIGSGPRKGGLFDDLPRMGRTR